MTTWMIHAVLVSVAVTLAAAAAERALRLWHRQARWAWCAAMSASIVLPAASVLQSLGWMPPGILTPVPAAFGTAGTALLPVLRIEAPTAGLDALAIGVWLAASLALATRLLLATRALERRRREWRATVLDGQPLCVSRDSGPAVVGFRHPTIVVPEWVLELDASLRALILRHEREHVERGDSRLLLWAVGLAVAVPWNLAVWYQLYRLRSAMEVDCDMRVLKAHPDARRYGSLLLAVAQRADRTGLLAAALIESSSVLRQRILSMRREIPSHRVARTLLVTAAAGLLSVVACEMNGPGEPRGQVRSGQAVMPGPAPLREFQVQKTAVPVPGSSSPRYPEALRLAGVEGEVLVQFVVDTAGRAEVSTLKVLRASHDEFADAVEKVLPQMRFTPAEVDGRKVRQLVQQPFTFSMTR